MKFCCKNNCKIFALLVSGTLFYSNDIFAGVSDSSAKVEIETRAGSRATLGVADVWAPLYRGGDEIIYGDLRVFSDNSSSKGLSLGFGYRRVAKTTGLGDGVFGLHAWVDSQNDNVIGNSYQISSGIEWFGEKLDILANSYLPIKGKKEQEIGSTNTSAPFVSGDGIFVNQTIAGRRVDEAQMGADFELGYLLPVFKEHIDSFRFYSGAYYFDDSSSDYTSGMTARISADITQNFNLGVYLDANKDGDISTMASFKFKFAVNGKQKKTKSKYRMDEIPYKRIGIQTGGSIKSVYKPWNPIAAINNTTGEAQKVIYVDNSAVSGGDGSLETPFNTLGDASGASKSHDIIYVNAGDGSSNGQNTGIILNKDDQRLIGSGVDFVYKKSDDITFKGALSKPAEGILIAKTTSPTITNVSGDGINILADRVEVSGFNIQSSSGNGIDIDNASGVKIFENSISANSKNGVNAKYEDNKDFTLDLSANSIVGNLENAVSITMAPPSDELLFCQAIGCSMFPMVLPTPNSLAYTSSGNVYSGSGLAGLSISGDSGASLSAVIEGDDYIGSNDGVVLNSSESAVFSVSVSNSEFSNNSSGGGFTFSSSSSQSQEIDLGGGGLGSVGGNALFDNAAYDLSLPSDRGTFKAENNWWGGGVAPTVSQVIGDVDYSPWLTSW